MMAICVSALGPALALWFFFPLLQLQALPDEPVRIEVTRSEGALQLHAIFEASHPPAGELRYQLNVGKRGAAGTSTTRQGGSFEAVPGLADTLSTVQLGVQPGDTVVAQLDVSGSAGILAHTDFREVIR